MMLYGRHWTKNELLSHIGALTQVGGITRNERVDGVERGNRAVEVMTGTGLEFTVVPDKGMDITRLFYRGVPCMWRSANGDVSPAFFESQGLGWMRSFPGGMFSTCGLTHFGSPCEDNGEVLGIHGRISNIPAYDVCSASEWEGDELRYKVTGSVRQSRVFGEDIVLHRTITTALGSSSIHIEDLVTNEGFESWPHMLLYHFNLGFPLIQPGTIINIPSREIIARDNDAQSGIDHWKVIPSPDESFREQVFYHVADAVDDVVTIEVVNPVLNMVLTLQYHKLELPHLFQWRMFGKGTYVLGIEPANSSAIQGRAEARKRGDLETIEPGESRTYRLDLSVTELG